MKNLAVLVLFLSLTFFNNSLQAQWVQTGSTGTGKVKGLVVNGSYIFAGTYPGGVYRSSNDGTDWSQVNSGMSITDINALGVNGTNIYSTGGIYVYRSTNNGANWTSANIGFNLINYFSFAFIGTNIIAGGSGGSCLSTNNGANWSVVLVGSQPMDTTSVYSLAVSGANVFAGTIGGNGGGIFISTNNGLSWTRCMSNKRIPAMTVMGNNIFAGSWGSGVYLSTNNGTTWTQVNSGLTALYVYSFAISGSSIFAGTNSGVFLSNNNGASWTQVGLTGNYVFSLAISGTNIFAGTSTAGVWRRPLSELTLPVELSSFSSTVQRRNVLLNWTTKTEKNSYKFIIERKTPNIDWTTIGSVKASNLSNSPKQYSFTDINLQSGKYQFRLKMIDNDGSFEYSKTIEAEVSVPTVYVLSQNYPNPFNPNTVISYSLPISSNIKLIVYNHLSQIIKTLESGYKNAGNYSINFNASNLPSGIYFYKLEAGQYSQIKKMILLK